ncbi:MAG: polyphosphate polymerase domain-containing protein [Anaerolineae bacterium]|nr:polyphosphate polymerase domain-containing protein [Anaerolineae bacterium]
MLDLKSSYETPRPLPAIAPVAHRSLSNLLSQMPPVGLGEIQDVALLRRFDTKIVLREDQLTRILAQLRDAYNVLEIAGQRIHRYHTLYFDTPTLTFYHQHHNGQRNRYKVRIRTYEDSGLAYLEVKCKTNQDITIKERLPLPESIATINAEGQHFLDAILPLPAATLLPVLGNTFRRVTLVSKQRAERLTLDIGLSFRMGRSGIVLPGIAIVEIKQPAYSLCSEFIGQTRKLGLRTTSFSKYCTGVALLAPQVKHNAFKPQLGLLDRIFQGGNN